LTLVSTYNEYLAEEYMSVDPDRLLPQGTIPTTNLEDAIRELEHCKKIGIKGVTINTFPSGKGYPTSEDDRFWAASIDLEMPLARHFGGRFGKFGGGSRSEPLFNYPKVIESPDNHKDDALTLLFSNCGAQWAMGAVQLAYAGVFDRFPKLQ